MAPFQLSVAVLVCISLTRVWALPKRPLSNGASSGAGEIPDEIVPEYRPFGEPLGEGFPGNGVFNDYDLDSNGGPEIFPEYDENEIHLRPPGDSEERPFKPDGRIPEEKHPEDERKEEPEEEEDHEPPSSEMPKGGEDEEEEEPEPEGEEEPKGAEEGDTHGVEDEEKLHVDDKEKQPHGDGGEDTQEGEEEVPLPFKAAIFTFKQVNHYIKQLEQAMEHVFKDTLEEAALLNNTFANTTEEEVEVDGHKFKVQKSLIKTGDDDSNSTLLIEEISSVNEDEPKKNRKERSNPDAEPIQ